MTVGRNAFGIHEFDRLMTTYTEHKGNPQAFSPDQRDRLYDCISKIRPQLTETFDLLQDQFRELSTIAGWGFDPRLVAAALNTRLNVATFKAHSWDEQISNESKLRAIESHIDAEAAATRVFQLLAEHLGLEKEDWLRGG